MDIQDLRKKNLEITKEEVKESVNEDHLIINTINTIEELDKILNSITMRFRDWLSLTLPELENKIKDSKKLSELVINKNYEPSVMGKELEQNDFNQIISLANQIKNLYGYQEELEIYLQKLQEKYVPNTQGLLGTLITAKLLREIKSLKKLATTQSGTIQLLGAEKALFRHIKTGARPPKYGYILNHQVVQNSKEKGKAARALSDKIAVCARLDYFKSEQNLGSKYLQELTDKWTK